VHGPLAQIRERVGSLKGLHCSLGCRMDRIGDALGRTERHPGIAEDPSP